MIEVREEGGREYIGVDVSHRLMDSHLIIECVLDREAI